MKFKKSYEVVTEEYDTDYPTKPIGGDNPYHMCAHCHRSVPAINGKLRNHYEWCEYRIAKEQSL